MKAEASAPPNLPKLYSGNENQLQGAHQGRLQLTSSRAAAGSRSLARPGGGSPEGRQPGSSAQARPGPRSSGSRGPRWAGVRRQRPPAGTAAGGGDPLRGREPSSPGDTRPGDGPGLGARTAAGRDGAAALGYAGFVLSLGSPPQEPGSPLPAPEAAPGTPRPAAPLSAACSGLPRLAHGGQDPAGPRRAGPSPRSPPRGWASPTGRAAAPGRAGALIGPHRSHSAGGEGGSGADRPHRRPSATAPRYWETLSGFLPPPSRFGCRLLLSTAGLTYSPASLGRLPGSPKGVGRDTQLHWPERRHRPYAPGGQVNPQSTGSGFTTPDFFIPGALPPVPSSTGRVRQSA